MKEIIVTIIAGLFSLLAVWFSYYLNNAKHTNGKTPERQEASLMPTIIIIVIIIGISVMTIPYLFADNQTLKRDQTMKDMRAIGTSLGAFYVDANIYPQQYKEGSFEINLLSTKEYHGSSYYQGTISDAWGKVFIYWSNGRTYRLVSYGKDKKLGGQEFDADIIYSDGRFIAP